MSDNKQADDSSVIKDEGFEPRSKANADIDTRYANLLRGHFEKPEEIIKNIGLYIKRTKLTRLLTYYELFKPTIDLPGDIVELGVFRGESLLTFAKLLECFCMGDRVKKVFGFDHFKGLQNFTEQDGGDYHGVDKQKGGWCGSDYYEELRELMVLFDADRFVPMKERLSLVEGDVCETIPRFAEDNPGLRISVLHFDLDLYEPTRVGLQHFYDKVVPGGIIIFDEYAFHQFAGETAAVDEFMKERGITTRLRTFNWFSNPGAYMVKE